MQNGLSENEYDGDLVYEFRMIVSIFFRWLYMCVSRYTSFYMDILLHTT